MGFNDFWINNNGKKEHLNNAKHGVRKEQVDKKFHNLFDAYDANGDGTLETEELGGVFKGLTKFAGADKTLDAAENKQVASLFANQAGIEDADFMGFVRSVSKATEDIVDSKTTPTADGGREVTTTYKDGSVETISYYPDGEYKFKKLDQKATTTTNFYTIGNDVNKKYTAAEIESRVKKAYNQRVAQVKANAEKNKPVEGKATYIIPNYDQFKQEYMQRNRINQGSDTRNFERHDFELSERGKQDVAVRDFVLSHYIDTHKAAQEALESMGILDDVGAAINAGAGELWNSIKNVWNGTEEEYQNFYELSKKFEPNYNKALRESGSLDVMRNNPEMFFRGFETDFKKDTGHKFDLQTASEFQETTERYQNATILNERLDILKDAMSEIRSYQSEQDALVHAPAQNEGLNPASHIVKANKLLLQYFNNDQEAVDMILNGTIGNAEATIKAISGIKEETETQMKNIIGDRSYDDMKKEYETQYKAMYGTDFVPDELTDKVMDAKATGGMVKLAAITIVSILVTRSPIMAEISGAAAGSAEATGAAANLVRTLVAKYGQTAVQQGIKLAMTSGTLATDVGLTLINQATSERGVNGEELWESTKGSAKYIFFGAYVGAPLAQAVSKSLGKIGATSRLFEGGTKTANGAIQTTSISGDKLIQNFVKGGNKVLTTGGAFLTDVAAFTGLEVATEGANLKDALSEQGQMLSKLKLMNHVLEYMLGAKAHTATSRANLDAAIEKSGVKNWNIKEIKTPQKTQYIVDIDGLPVGKFEDANQLATAMLERVTANYSESAKPQTRTQITKPEGEVKATPETEVTTKTARRDALKAELRDGKKVTTSEGINIPAGKLEAPNAKFAETDEAFRSIVTKRSADIKELDKISDIDEFCRKSFELMKEEMGLEDSDIKLEITDDDNHYDVKTNTVYISRNWAGHELKNVKGKGDKAEIFGGIAHELNHYLQWKEVVLNLDMDNPKWVELISTLQQFEGAQKNIEYLMEKYPDNTELKEAFEKAKSYQDNWLNYTDAFDENGKLKTGAEYDKYRNQTVEAVSFRRGDIVAEEYRKTVADVKPEGAEENPLLTRLETANDRESFVAIRDEIKKMPNGEEKTQLMQAYLKKYNEWSADPSRPDIRMEYKPEEQTSINIKKLKIEKASDEDLKEIQKIDLEAFEGKYTIDSNFDAYKADLVDQEITTYAIKGEDGKVIGYYQLEPIENGELYIHSIGVRSDLRNTKASYAALKQMQDNITKFAQENNIEKVALDVDADNSALVKLYKKFGFEVTNETSGFEAGHQYHDYHMEADVKKVLSKGKAKDEVNDVAETKAIESTETKGEIKPQERAEDAEVKQDEIENTKVIDDSTPATEKTLNSIRTVLKEDESISDEHLERLITSIPNEHCANVLAKYIGKLKATENEDIHYLRYLKTPERIQEFVELLEDKDMPEITPVVARIMPLVDDKAELKTIIESGYLSGERRFDFGEFNATLEIEDPEWQANLIKLHGSRLFSNVPWYELYRNAEHMDLSNLDRIDKMMDRLNWHDSYPIEEAKALLRLPNTSLDVIEKRGLLRNIEGREEKLCPSDVIKLSEVDNKTWETIKQRGLLKDIEDENLNGKYTHGLKSEQIIGLAELADEEYANVQKRQLLTLKDIRSYYGDDFIGGSDLHTLAAMDDATFSEFKNLYDMTYTKIENKRVGGQYQDVETKERRFRVHECVKIVTASDEIKQRITKNNLLNQVRNGKPLSGDEIMQIASQNGNKQVLVDKFLAMKNSKGEDRFSPNEANTLAELSEEKLKIAEERHLFDEYPVTRSYGTENESFSAYNIEDLINIPDKIWNQMEKSNLKTGISPYDYVKLSEMTEAQWKRAFECGMLPATNPPRIDIDEMINVTSLDDKCWQRYTEDLLPVRENIQIGADGYSWSKKDVQEITSFDDVAYSRYKDIMTIQRGNYRLHRFSLGDFKNISQVTDEQWSRIKDDLYKIDNLDKQLSSQEIKTLAELDDKAYGRVAEIIKKFQTVGDKFDLQNKIDKLIEVAQCDDAAYERVKPLLGSELISADVEKLAQMVKLTPNQHERLNNDLAGLNISKESKMVIAALPQDRYEEAIKLATSPLRGGYGQSLDGEVISKLLDLPSEKYNKVKDLIVLENSNGYQIQLGKYGFESDIEVLLNDEMMQRFKKDLLPIAKNNEKPILPTSVGNLKAILELSDAEYKQALENIKYINSVPTKINEYQIKDFALLDKETFAKVKRDLISIDSLGEHQLGGYDIEKIAKLEPENYERCLTEIIPIADKYLKLESYYSDENPILTMSKLSNEDYQKIKEFLPELPQLTSKQIKEFVKLSKSELENFVNRDIPGSTLSFDECIKLAQLSEDQYIKLIERANPETPLSYSNMEKISEMSDEQYPIVRNALEFFNKNIKLLKHQDMDVTPKLLSNMIVDNSNGLQNVIDIVGDSGLRHAVGLKYKGLKQLLENATSLSNLDEGTKIILRDKLNELPHPEQKLAKLEIISALANNVDKTAITKILDEIKAPQMTKEQKELADRIFVSDKSYTEQIEDFIREFNVPDERQDLIRKFLLEQKLSEKYVTPPSIDEQIAIMDKKIQSIQRNDKIPADKKQAYLNQLERQKAEILANPEQYTQARINDRAMKPLEAQVEAHINLPNQNNAFTKALNKEIYNILKIDPTEELLTDVTYDSKYVSRMFAGMSDSNFRMNFNKLINMIKENPNRKFTDIIQEIPENIETRKLFEENGLDFDKWIKFNEDSYEPFVVTVDVDKSVRSAKQNLKNELNSELAKRLDQNQIAKINQILVENGFETAGQKDLPKIIKLIEKELDTGEYWKQDTPEIKTFKDHIQIHKKNIHDVEQLKDATEELHVRLWDKDDVGRNIFFGNHVGCCTSVGSFNSFAAPQHLMNAFVNGIEIVDKAGNSMGNSMCCFAKVDGKLTFVIDSFEANGKLGAAPEVTNAIIEYAKKVCAEMGQPDANVMFGPNYNKIDFSRCIRTNGHTIEVIGRAPENTYIDCIGGRGNINSVASDRDMHEIMDL